MFDPASFLKKLNRCAIMAIVNITGDSFSEGPSSAPESAVRRAFAFIEEGADILDLGAESTRPGSTPVTPPEECKRLLPVLKELRSALPHTIISVDTRHGETALAALEHGADIINDVAMGRDAELLRAVAVHRAGLVLCHSRGTPADMNSSCFTNYPDGVRKTVEYELFEAVSAAVAKGVLKENIWLDPGVGFAKTPEQCRTLIREAAVFTREYPWLWGISRKSFMGGTPDSRNAESVMLESRLIADGAAVIRTHNVKALRQQMNWVKEGK